MAMSDKNCFNIPDILDEWTLLIANNSQVFASRIPLYNTKVVLKNGESTILEKWEIFIVRVIFQEDWSIDTSQCIIRGSDKKNFRPWCTIFFDKEIYGTSKEFVDDGIVFELYNTDLITLCKNYGDIPLPPYITQASPQDKEKYKTSFWQKIGSVATPTAWLHFTNNSETISNNIISIEKR
jgi:S-adenosylmethionine:tRNA ribosyltransferase-isomerase